jgi:hypothetical protein
MDATGLDRHFALCTAALKADVLIRHSLPVIVFKRPQALRTSVFKAESALNRWRFCPEEFPGQQALWILQSLKARDRP